MAYLEPIRVSIVGDKTTGARYVRDARRIAYEVLRQTREAGVQSARRRFTDPARQLTIEVVVAGSIVSAVITVGGGEQLRFLPDDFVIWPRDINYPDGIDEQYPQLIAKAPETDRSGWATFFKSAEIPAFESFGGRKGTYGERFPNGVRFAGNVDWRGKDGERVSWYGPERRYWAAPYLSLHSQYGPFVFILGHKLLDLRDYDGFPEQFVMGACIVGTFLYVVQAGLPSTPPGGSTYPSTGRPYEEYYSPLFPTQSFVTRLVRYTITRNPEKQVPEAWSIAKGSHISLWSIDEPGWINPWFFNLDASRAVSVRNPETSLIKVYVDTPDAGEPSSYEFLPVAEENDIGELVREGDTYSLKRTTTRMPILSGSTEEAIIASDFDEKGNRVDLYIGYEPFRAPVPANAWVLPYRYFVPPTWHSDPDELIMLRNRRYLPEPEPPYGYQIPDWAEYYVRVGDFRINLRRTTYVGVRVILHAIDLRYGAFVLDRVRRTDRPPADDYDSFDMYFGTWQAATEVWHHYVLKSKYERPPGYRPQDYIDNYDHIQYFAARAGGSTFAPLLMVDSVTTVSGKASSASDFPTIVQDEVREVMLKSPCFRAPIMFADPTQTFGVRARYGLSGALTSVTPIVQASVEHLLPPYQPKFDFDGYAASQALAVTKDALMYGGLALGYVDHPGGRGRASIPIEHATNGDLPTITGVTGDERRYHPIWVLGQVPKLLT